MNCPVCGHDENTILEVRDARRRRECTASCRHRWTTHEITAERLERLERLEALASAIAQELDGDS